MVQRKGPEKLGIQASFKNYFNSDKLNKAVKSSSSQNSDIKSKGGGPELKKMMKKSRSIKRSDKETSESHPLRRAKGQSNKVPPTCVAPVVATTPKKPSPVKLPDASPNYMKSTASSSNAKKERPQVIPSSSKTRCDSKSPRLNYPKLSCDSSHKSVKALTKISSLKPVRTLTKTSSNKGGRPSMKKKSGVVLYPNQNVERATCSSTLKDSKFPRYVMLHPGGTESDGTSVMKVCPYTYCSLNGHHHAQLPPLKQFLSTRRRLLKAQKSMRLKNQSPVAPKRCGPRKKEIDTGRIVLIDHPTIVEADSATYPGSPLKEEVELDYFVEIYVQPREDTGDFDSVTDEANETHDANLSEISSHSVVTEMDTSMIFSDHSSLPASNAGLGGCSIANEAKTDSPAESDVDESIFGTMEMEWEEGQVVNQNLGYEADEPNPMCMYSQELADDNIGKCSEEVPPCEEILVVHEENNVYVHTALSNDALGFDYGDYNPPVELSSKLSTEDHTVEGSLPDQHSFDEEVFEDKDEINELEDFASSGDSSSPVESQLEKLTAASEDGVSENNFCGLQEENSVCSIVIECGTHMEEQEECEAPEHETEKDIFSEDADDDADSGYNGSQLTGCHANTKDGAEEKRRDEESFGLIGGQISGYSQVSGETYQNKENDNQLDGKEMSILTSNSSKGDTDSKTNALKSVEGRKAGEENAHTEDQSEVYTTEKFLAASDAFSEEETTIINVEGCDSDQQLPENHGNLGRSRRCKSPTNNCDEQREFNPRGPNFLPIVPDPEAEKVDLRHQMVDERKNAEEWMLDYALRQTVNKLAPARKRRVALLVEAFEKVTPLPQYGGHLQSSPVAFTQTRFIQACS